MLSAGHFAIHVIPKRFERLTVCLEGVPFTQFMAYYQLLSI